MTRSRIIIINLISWALGILALWAGNIALTHLIRPGVVRTALYFLLLATVVTVFGGTYGLLARGKKNSSGL